MAETSGAYHLAAVRALGLPCLIFFFFFIVRTLSFMHCTCNFICGLSDVIIKTFSQSVDRITADDSSVFISTTRPTFCAAYSVKSICHPSRNEAKNLTRRFAFNSWSGCICFQSVPLHLRHTSNSLSSYFKRWSIIQQLKSTHKLFLCFAAFWSAAAATCFRLVCLSVRGVRVCDSACRAETSATGLASSSSTNYFVDARKTVTCSQVAVA